MTGMTTIKPCHICGELTAMEVNGKHQCAAHFDRRPLQTRRRGALTPTRPQAHPDNPNGHPIDPSWYKDGRTS